MKAVNLCIDFECDAYSSGNFIIKLLKRLASVSNSSTPS